MEQRRVQFRCAETGKIFYVSFMRYSPSHKFQLTSITKKIDKPSINLEGHSLKSSYHSQKSFDASDFDWTGWFCPYCGHKESYFECGKCNEYICGKRMRRLQNGTQTFACHDECGNTGEIKGFIKSFTGSQERIYRNSSNLSSGDASQRKSLPPSRKQFPPSDIKPQLQ